MHNPTQDSIYKDYMADMKDPSAWLINYDKINIVMHILQYYARVHQTMVYDSHKNIGEGIIMNKPLAVYTNKQERFHEFYIEVGVILSKYNMVTRGVVHINATGILNYSFK